MSCVWIKSNSHCRSRIKKSFHNQDCLVLGKIQIQEKGHVGKEESNGRTGNHYVPTMSIHRRRVVCRSQKVRVDRTSGGYLFPTGGRHLGKRAVSSESPGLGIAGWGLSNFLLVLFICS